MNRYIMKKKPNPSKEIRHRLGNFINTKENTPAHQQTNRRRAHTHESQIGPNAGTPLVSRSYTNLEVTGPLLMIQTHSALLAL